VSFGLQVSGFGFKVSGSRFRVQGFGFQVSGSRFRLKVVPTYHFTLRFVSFGRLFRCGYLPPNSFFRTGKIRRNTRLLKKWAPTILRDFVTK
jgi:hypothetical protein